METSEKVKSRWTRSFFTALDRRQNEEKYECDICHKDFSSPSALALHRSTHVIERRYRCEPCQVSFHSPGHLQKHIRSSAHETRVEMTQAFGVPTSDNPRPYGCSECDIAFRKHGHLAKHLRSKSHITKLEQNGLIPTGTYAALEKSGNAELRDRMVTTNCEQSILSLRSIAISLFQDDQADMEAAPAANEEQPSTLPLSQQPQSSPQPEPDEEEEEEEQHPSPNPQPPPQQQPQPPPQQQQQPPPQPVVLLEQMSQLHQHPIQPQLSQAPMHPHSLQQQHHQFLLQQAAQHFQQSIPHFSPVEFQQQLQQHQSLLLAAAMQQIQAAAAAAPANSDHMK